MVLSFGAPQVGAYDWLQFNGDPQHSGNNTIETTLGAGNVSSLALKYHAALPAIADGAPVFLDGVTTPAGVKDLLFIATKAGDLVALDVRTGAQVWIKQYPNTLPPASCPSGNPPCSTTSSPAIDPNRQYVYAYGLDGYVHKLQVGDGTEVLTGGWPEPTTLKPGVEKQSSALAVASVAGNGYLYATSSAHFGDSGNIQGHLTTINLATGTQNVFNMVCSDQPVHFVLSPGSPDCPAQLAGGWARPGVIYDAGTGRIFVGSGNGPFNAAVNYWGDSILALNPNGTGAAGKPVDSYTPTTQSTLEGSDLDLGSTAPAILPVPLSSNVQHLAVQGGKDAKLRLLNLANLSGAGGPGNLGGEVGAVINVPQGGVVLTQPAVWVNPGDGSTWVFVVNSAGSSGLKLAIDGSGNPSLALQWQKSFSGASPLVANGVLYFAGGGTLRGLDPTTGNQLWSTTQIGAIHWQSPVVACATVYVLDQSSQLSAFTLPLSLSSVAGGNGQSTIAGTAFGAPLSVRVTDASNNPLSGVLVTFMLPSSGATAMFPGNASSATATTDASGIANSPLATANAVPGNYTATATISGGACSAIFSLSNTAPMAAGASTIYTPIEPCRIMDTRNATVGSGVQGPITGGALKQIPGYITAGSNWGSYGGNGASDCGLTNPPGTSIKAVAIVITILNPNFDAFVGVSDIGDISTTLSTVALNYTHGQGLSTMYIVPQIASNNIYFAMPTGLSAHLIFDVVGYFVVSDATALACTTVTSGPVTIGAASTGSAVSPACGAGYTLNSGSCDSDSTSMKLTSDKASGGNTTWTCTANNAGASAHLTATANCCRVPGK